MFQCLYIFHFFHPFFIIIKRSWSRPVVCWTPCDDNPHHVLFSCIFPSITYLLSTIVGLCFGGSWSPLRDLYLPCAPALSCPFDPLVCTVVQLLCSVSALRRIPPCGPVWCTHGQAGTEPVSSRAQGRTERSIDHEQRRYTACLWRRVREVFMVWGLWKLQASRLLCSTRWLYHTWISWLASLSDTENKTCFLSSQAANTFHVVVYMRWITQNRPSHGQKYRSSSEGEYPRWSTS